MVAAINPLGAAGSDICPLLRQRKQDEWGWITAPGRAYQSRFFMVFQCYTYGSSHVWTHMSLGTESQDMTGRPVALGWALYRIFGPVPRE